MMKNNKMMKKMENGEKVIGMLHHVTIQAVSLLTNLHG